MGRSLHKLLDILSIALMVRKETSHKRGVQTKRKRAAWDPDYLLKLLAAGLAS